MTPRSSAKREDRWQHLVQLAFRLEEECAVRGSTSADQARVEQRVRAALDSLLEVFPTGLDPNDDFEAYAVRRFAATLRTLLYERR